MTRKLLKTTKGISWLPQAYIYDKPDALAVPRNKADKKSRQDVN
jgi:hypothetical protein